MLRLFLFALISGVLFATQSNCPVWLQEAQIGGPPSPAMVEQLRRDTGFASGSYIPGVPLKVSKGKPFPATITAQNMGNFGAFPEFEKPADYVGEAIAFAQSRNPCILTRNKTLGDREFFYRFHLRDPNELMILSRGKREQTHRILLYYRPRKQFHYHDTNLDFIRSVVRYSIIRHRARLADVESYHYVREEKLVEHFEKHGEGVGARNPADYLKKSRWAAQNRRDEDHLLSVRGIDKTFIFDPVFGTLVVAAVKPKILYSYHVVELDQLVDGMNTLEYVMRTFQLKMQRRRERRR